MMVYFGRDGIVNSPGPAVPIPASCAAAVTVMISYVTCYRERSDLLQGGQAAAGVGCGLEQFSISMS